MDTTKINSSVLAQATAKYKNFALFALSVAGVFVLVIFFTKMFTAGLTIEGASASFDALSSQRTKTELELKDAISKTLEAQKALDTATQEADKLRESRKSLDEQINALINPTYKPEEVK